jgi:FkbM family methyltransferase
MARSGGKTDIAFLKVDTEGADGRVLRGAEKLLRAKKIN